MKNKKTTLIATFAVLGLMAAVVMITNMNNKQFTGAADGRSGQTPAFSIDTFSESRDGGIAGGGGRKNDIKQADKCGGMDKPHEIAQKLYTCMSKCRVANPEPWCNDVNDQYNDATKPGVHDQCMLSGKLQRLLGICRSN
jgi:hypothetical protein